MNSHLLFIYKNVYDLLIYSNYVRASIFALLKLHVDTDMWHERDCDCECECKLVCNATVTVTVNYIPFLFL